MYISKIFLLSFLYIFSSSFVIAGPFGLEMGMSLKDIGGKTKEIKKCIYVISSVPKPHSFFDAYVVTVGQKTGLCMVKAVTKNFHTNVYGFEIKSAFKDFLQKIESKYGKYNLMDNLLPGSIWNDEKDWMTSLKKNERSLTAFWEKEYGSNLTDNIQSIMLAARAVNDNSGFITVEYYFTNNDECEKEISSVEDKSL